MRSWVIWTHKSEIYKQKKIGSLKIFTAKNVFDFIKDLTTIYDFIKIVFNPQASCCKMEKNKCLRTSQ